MARVGRRVIDLRPPRVEPWRENLTHFQTPTFAGLRDAAQYCLWQAICCKPSGRFWTVGADSEQELAQENTELREMVAALRREVADLRASALLWRKLYEDVMQRRAAYEPADPKAGD